MSLDHYAAVIEDQERKLREVLKQATDYKRMINMLLQSAGQPPKYDLNEDLDVGPGAIRADEFYGQPMATVVRKILERRKATKGAASVNDIYQTMIEGGYHFETKNTENAKRTLRISLSKNPIFHRIPTPNGEGKYGLLEWYPSVKKPKGRDSVDDSEPDDSEPLDISEVEVEGVEDSHTEEAE